MNSEPLNISHRELLEERFKKIQPVLSEYSFANLYLFRHLHDYRVITFKKEVYIQGKTRDNVIFLMPTTSPTDASIELLKEVATQAQILFPIQESWLTTYMKFFLNVSFSEADSDYIFSINKLAHYPGRHLSKKRNLVKQLFNTHEVKTEDISEKLDDANEILEQWRLEHNENFTQTDYASCLEALKLFIELHLHGRIIYVDQKPAGFIMGQWISTDCYTAHFSKATRTIKGIYQYLYQHLALSIEGSCSWINLEQDLGVPAIHDAKHSYLPDKLERKWRIQLK